MPSRESQRTRLYRKAPTTGRFKDLRSWRVAHQYNQTEAAKLLRVSQSMISKFECGVYVPKAKLAKRISDQTGVSLEAVLGLA